MNKLERAAPPAEARRTGRLHASERQARILAAFENGGFVSIAALAEQFGVSGMTVRRDLTLLDKRGLLERTHGGAVAIGLAHVGYDSVEPTFEQRMLVHGNEKASIAEAAAALVGPSESIGMDVGTSIMALAQALAPRRDLRIFTNSLRVATHMAEGNSTVYILSGQVRAPEFSVIGPQAADGLASHFLDRFFLGVSGIDENGLYDYSPEDTEVKRAFIEHAGSVVVLCDASKFGRRALSRIAPLDRIDILITDQAPPADIAKALAAANARTIVAS